MMLAGTIWPKDAGRRSEMREAQMHMNVRQLCGLSATLVLAGPVDRVVTRARDTPSVACTVVNDPRGRVFVLDQSPGTSPPVWRLSMQDHESGTKWIRLSLPGAAPRLGEGSAHLEFRNGNGGRQVSLDVTPHTGRLTVFVDYGLDVNIEPDLDPAVDRMSTDGPLTSLTCTVSLP
jgi:hypothetical protein